MKNRIISIALCGVIIVAVNACSGNSYLESADTKTVSESIVAAEDYKSAGYVQIGGAVNNPGVYEIVGSERLFNVIEMAGGFTEDAAVDSVNQVKIVSDEDIVYIPTVSEVEEQKDMSSSDNNGKININLADTVTLMTLSGIGESKAKLIVDFREENGPFKSIEDIMTIPGIKEGVYNKIKDCITVG